MVFFQPASQVLPPRMLLHFLITRLPCLTNIHTYLMSPLQKVKEKDMPSELFETMSDRSSVKKLFNEKLFRCFRYEYIYQVSLLQHAFLVGTVQLF